MEASQWVNKNDIGSALKRYVHSSHYIAIHRCMIFLYSYKFNNFNTKVCNIQIITHH